MRTASYSRLSMLALVLVLSATGTRCRPAEPADAAPAQPAEAAEREITALVGRIADATNARDFAALAADVTDDWTFVTSGGKEVGVTGFAELISGWTEVHIAVADLRPRLSDGGLLAWLTFTGHLTGVAAGRATERRLRFTGILVRSDAGWKLRHLQSTIVAN